MSFALNMMDRWLSSGQTARICGLDFTPRPLPWAPQVAQCITKGQATVYVLQQVPQGYLWFLKKFALSRRPSDSYLSELVSHIPGFAGFFSCTQRRLLTASHFDYWASVFRDRDLGGFLDGCILTPKVPGQAWATLAEELRGGEAVLPLNRRVELVRNLARAVRRLEAGECSHRDLSGGNVFVDSDGRIYLIDWDSLFHPALPYQPNTTIGTNGYIAPFTGGPDSEWDARRSWVPYADRFALAILIAEFLLTEPSAPPAREDGTLFSQDQLVVPASAGVQELLDRLRQISRPVAGVLNQALRAGGFEQCPSPEDWLRALNRGFTSPAAPSASMVEATCDRCQVPIRIPRGLFDDLRARGRPVLCRTCLQESRAQQAQDNSLWMGLLCEHCRRPLQKARLKAEQLRQKGKPILCPSCLGEQLVTWKAEQQRHDEQFPSVICTRCGTNLRVPRAKLELLGAHGRGVLCRTCLAAARPITPFRLPRLPFFRFTRSHP